VVAGDTNKIDFTILIDDRGRGICAAAIEDNPVLLNSYRVPLEEKEGQVGRNKMLRCGYGLKRGPKPRAFQDNYLKV
jgi:hypothetical protein